jgi:ankyrin repeat protein
VKKKMPKKDGRVALVQACKLNRDAVVQALVKIGADVNLAEAESGLTPLMAAAKNNNRTLVQFLLDNGAHRRARDSKVRLPKVPPVSCLSQTLICSAKWRQTMRCRATPRTWLSFCRFLLRSLIFSPLSPPLDFAPTRSLK